MGKFIDLTGTVENGMWEYGPPFPPVSVEQVSALDDGGAYAGEYGVNAFRISFSSSSATYVQTSAEMFSGRPGIDQVPLERLILPAAVARIPKAARGVISVADLESAAPETRPGDALVVATGWEKSWNRPGFVSESPHFTPESMKWVLDSGVSMLAGDMTIYDDYEKPTGLLRDLFARDVLVVAPLVNLDALSGARITLFALPLKVRGVSGCPCRVLALEETG